MRTEAAEIFVGETCLPGVLRLPDGDGTAPGIVFTNGYAAYREMYDQMAIALCGAGYATLQYDTRGTSGMGRGDSSAAHSGWKMRLRRLDTYRHRRLWTAGRIALAGVSMGGAVTIMQGAADPRVKCLFAMAPVSTGWELIRDPWLCSRGEKAWMAFWERMLRDAERTAQGWPSELVPVEYAVGGRLEPERKNSGNGRSIRTRCACCLWNPYSTVACMWTRRLLCAGYRNRFTLYTV